MRSCRFVGIGALDSVEEGSQFWSRREAWGCSSPTALPISRSAEEGERTNMAAEARGDAAQVYQVRGNYEGAEDIVGLLAPFGAQSCP